MMQKECTWGTHIEIYAMASVLHIPVYLYTKKMESIKEYYWQVFKPLRINTNFLSRQESLKLLSAPPGYHIELLHSNGTHFDLILTNSEIPVPFWSWNILYINLFVVMWCPGDKVWCGNYSDTHCGILSRGKEKWVPHLCPALPFTAWPWQDDKMITAYKFNMITADLPNVPVFPGLSRNSSNCPGVPELQLYVPDFSTLRFEQCKPCNHVQYVWAAHTTRPMAVSDSGAPVRSAGRNQCKKSQ